MSKPPVLHVKKLRDTAVLPQYGSAFAAGADLFACTAQTLAPGETKLIPTGLAMEIPAGFAGLVYARSGLACKRGLAPANKVGVIDADYRGELLVPLHNHSNISQEIASGERIAQLIITPFLAVQFEEAAALEDTARGAGGFGSTGN